MTPEEGREVLRDAEQERLEIEWFLRWVQTGERRSLVDDHYASERDPERSEVE